MALSKTFEPLRVVAYLRTPIVSDQWLPLDGILLYQATRWKLGPQVTTLPGGEDSPDNVTMPLLKVHNGTPNWYFACSWAQPQPWWVAEGQDHWNKRFDSGFSDLVNFEGKRGKVIIEQGQYKAYHMPVFYRVAERVEWYCIGDKERIEALLSTCTHCGKKAVQGWGRVNKWVVKPVKEDWSVWKDGQLTRGVPADDMIGKWDKAFNIGNYGIRPAYYRKRNQMMLVLP